MILFPHRGSVTGILAAGWLLTGLPLAAEVPPQPGTIHDGLAPADAVAAFTAYDGFRVEMVAAEPDVRQPVAMSIDHRGRLWVAEAYGYPTRNEGDEGGDRILIFEDGNGDGTFETRKIFIEGLNLVSGLEVGFGGVWVGAAPYLLFIPDRDGDDVPDGPPERLLDGWGWQDTHETLNSFIWGPDGWLYGCHGVFTHSRVGKPGTPDEERSPINAGVWRFHPGSRVFEVFAHGTSNPWGLDFDDHGQAFITACVIPHLYHVIQGGRYQRQAGRHFDPHTYDDIKTIADHLHYSGSHFRDGVAAGIEAGRGGGHAHCGLSIYLGDQFPPQFRNALLFNNLHGHRINHNVAGRNRSGYVGSSRPDFLFSNDRQHMGIALRYGPDGGLFLIDWYDKQTCHHTLHEAWDRSNGRIYKITYGEAPPRQVDLAAEDDLALVRHHLAANDWYVRTARRLLHERRLAGRAMDAGALAELRELLGHPDETRRLRGLWTLHAIGDLTDSRLLEVLRRDAGEHVRAWAVQLLNESPPSPEVVEALVEHASVEKSAHVRLYLASALQRWPLDRRRAMAAALLARGEDADDPNIPLILWYGVADLAASDPALALELAMEARIPLVRRFLIRRLAGDEAGRERVLAAVVGAAQDSNIPADAVIGLGQALGDARSLPAPPSWEAAAAVFDRLADDVSRRELEKLATVFGDVRASGRFRNLVADPTAAKEDRLAALENLQRMQDPELADILMGRVRRSDDPLRIEWLRALGREQARSVAPLLLGLYPGFSAEEKQAAVLVLATTSEGARELAGALASGSIPRGEVSAFAVRQMRNFGDQTIDDLLAEHWGVVGAGGGNKQAEIARWLAALTPEVLAGADLRRGRAVYRAACHACHVLMGDGNPLGPDLTGSNRSDLGYVLENILDPGAIVGLDYQLHLFELHDGRTMAGMLRGSSDSAMTVAMVGSPDLVLRHDEIREHRISPVSLMPEGLLDNLTSDEVRDLIGYLRSPRQVPLPSPGELVIDDADLSVGEIGGGKVSQQDMSGFSGGAWSNNRQLWWTGGKPGDSLALGFGAQRAGRHEVYAVFTMARDYASVRLSLNDEPAGEFDLYHPQVVTTGEVLLGSFELEEGSQELVVTITGAHPDAVKSHLFGIDRLRLVPME